MMIGVRTPALRRSRQTSKPSFPGSHDVQQNQMKANLAGALCRLP
jgi:hypothetical protein